MKKDLILDRQDLRYLEWSRIRRSSGTAGSFLKSFRTEKGKKQYFKLSNYDTVRGVTGHECVNELIADRLLTILGIKHLHYQLIHALILVNGKEQETWLCASDDFKNSNESKTALDVFFQLEKEEDEIPLEFCIRMGWESYIYEMLLVDFLILNRDRHGANIEILRDRSARSIRLAPLFDHGISMFFQCKNDAALDREDVMEDKRIQSFVGTDSAYENLKLIPKEKMPEVRPLQQADRQILFAGLEQILSQKHLDKLWELLWKRWSYYEDFCDKR
ncbi:MAG: hypothetical protein IJI10_12110 [Eubacterium sp.]|nr:hypothetical protein [Eubacterium sp.]